jgi:RNA polymerase sigma factor (sigma-70 family)
MQTTEQADLAQRLLDDDEQVLEDILRAFGPLILVVMGRRYAQVLKEPDIEDVLSIGLYRLWVNRQRFDRNKASLKVWLFRIVENAARDVLRHGWQKARQLEVCSDSALTGVADPQSNGRGQPELPDSHSSKAKELTQEQMDLREIISELPAQQRHIILADAATRDGVASSQWLAEELSLSESSVRVYRKRAMDRIRSELEARGHTLPGKS